MAKKTNPILHSLIDFLDRREIKYQPHLKDGYLVCSFKTESVFNNVDMIFQVIDGGCVVFTLLNVCVPDDKRSGISNLICEINSEFLYGNFDYIVSTGEIRYKVFTDLGESDLKEDVIDRVIMVSLYMVETNGDRIMKYLLD